MMGFNSRVIKQAIREQMMGRVPDLNRIKREQDAGVLELFRGRDKKEFFGIRIKDRYGNFIVVHKLYNVPPEKIGQLRGMVDRYSREYHIRLSQLSDTKNPAGLRQIQDDFDRMVYGVRDITLEDKPKGRGKMK